MSPAAEALRRAVARLRKNSRAGHSGPRGAINITEGKSSWD